MPTGRQVAPRDTMLTWASQWLVWTTYGSLRIWKQVLPEGACAQRATAHSVTMQGRRCGATFVDRTPTFWTPSCRRSTELLRCIMCTTVVSSVYSKESKLRSLTWPRFLMHILAALLTEKRIGRLPTCHARQCVGVQNVLCYQCG